MDISEIFYSIQGESTYCGLPCIFIRTSGCNLSCSYCDTAYADVINHQFTPEEIIKAINIYNKNAIIEITGGEPLLQKDIYSLFDLLHLNKRKILLETNGSILLDKVPAYVNKIIDVKTPSSNHKDSFVIENLNFYNPQYDNLKFVIGSIEDYDWTKEFLFKYNLNGNSIVLSTVFSRISPQKICESILKDNLNIRFQLQLHKYIWDANKKGV